MNSCWRELTTNGIIQINKVQVPVINKGSINMKLKNLAINNALVFAALSAGSAIAQSGYSNPYGAGYYQSTNPYGNGYVKDKNVFGFYGN